MICCATQPPQGATDAIIQPESKSFNWLFEVPTKAEHSTQQHRDQGIEGCQKFLVSIVWF